MPHFRGPSLTCGRLPRSRAPRKRRTVTCSPGDRRWQPSTFPKSFPIFSCKAAASQSRFDFAKIFRGVIGGRTRTRTFDPVIKSQLLWDKCNSYLLNVCSTSAKGSARLIRKCLFLNESLEERYSRFPAGESPSAASIGVYAIFPAKIDMEYSRR